MDDMIIIIGWIIMGMAALAAIVSAFTMIFFVSCGTMAFWSSLFGGRGFVAMCL